MSACQSISPRALGEAPSPGPQASRPGDVRLAEGLAQLRRGDLRAAKASLDAAATLDPMLPGVWRALGDACTRLGQPQTAGEAYLKHVETAIGDPDLMRAADALAANRLDVAERELRARLRAEPTDIAAMRMLGELAARLGRYTDAEALLERALELAPGFTAARRNYAVVLYRQMKAQPALEQLCTLRTAGHAEPSDRMLEAGASALLGDYARSVALYEALLADHPDQPKLWLSYGHALKTLGRIDESLAAYRRCIALAPGMGEAWWSLANLKTARFNPEERRTLQHQAERVGNAEEDQLHLDYALGKALEDEGATAEAFAHYARGAAVQRRRLGYDADETTTQVERVRTAFTAELMRTRAGQGAPDPDPIFIVGLPRSGSTLVEQVLSSHPEVEGTMELPELPALARRIADLAGEAYPSGIARLSGAALRSLGRDYLDATRPYRRTERPYFIDKLPNNWLHVGLIRLILPSAKIIDARRHPMATGFSAFKQHFARGQAFSYGLEDVGRYYRDYAGLMAHFDDVAPGAVHRVIYEQMVQDTEGEVRRLLAHCGLGFDAACLSFHETKRAVRTASAAQVRRPIYREGLDQWRRFEAELEPLRRSLGATLEDWASPPG